MAQMVFIMLPRAMICVGRISAVLSHTPEITDVATPAPIPEKTDDVIRFDNVCFRFPDADEETLANLTFTCKRGQTTALIGSTGSGKSTIAKLLLRFHDCTLGTVSFNGIDIRQLPQEELRKHIAYVPQRAWLFSGTIAENLRYGNRQATESAMRKALSVAQADFVCALPENLSSPHIPGRNQLLRWPTATSVHRQSTDEKADLYIFDDSFSALDFKTDLALRKALAKETQNAAVLIIAQRISTIVNAEQILVLDDGKIVGMGTHQTLLESCPVYQEIAKSQMRGGESQ